MNYPVLKMNDDSSYVFSVEGLNEVEIKALHQLSDNGIITKANYQYYELFVELNKRISEQHCLTIAIDGMCGSGKSVLGKLIADSFDGNLFHMDDFYLQAYQRTPERYNTPGENADHERFEKEVLIPLMAKEDVEYHTFNHDGFTVNKEYTIIPYKSVNVVEGSYTLQKDLQHYFDYSIYLTIDSEFQKKRILNRSNEKVLQMFIDRWIPLEMKYFNAYHLENIADYCLYIKE